jgi:hypothetical protein
VSFGDVAALSGRELDDSARPSPSWSIPES